MKKIRPAVIILFVALALVGGALVYVGYRISRAFSSFPPPPVSLEDKVSGISDGYAKRLLEKLGYPVKSFFINYKLEGYSAVIRRYDEDDDWDAWRQWLEEGKKLILLAKIDHSQKKTVSIAREHPLLEGVESLYLNPALTLEDFDFPFDNTQRVWVLAEHGRPLIMRDTVGRGEVIYIADASIWSDAGLIKGRNGFLLNNCLKDRYPETVVFDERASMAQGIFDGDEGKGIDAGTPFILFQGRFLPLFLQALLLGIIFCLVYWKRFGPPRDPEQFARRSLLRHLSATGNFFEKTRNPGVFADILDRYFFSRLRELLHSTGGTAADLKAVVKNRLGLSPEEEDAFSVSITKHLVARDDRRERIILRLKGVEDHHGKNKNTG